MSLWLSFYQNTVLFANKYALDKQILIKALFDLIFEIYLIPDVILIFIGIIEGGGLELNDSKPKFSTLL